MRKKIVSPAHRRAAAAELVAAGLCSGRAVCRYLGLARSTFRYQGRPATVAEAQLRKELLALSAKHPRYGYRRIAALVKAGRLACRPATHSKTAPSGRAAGATDRVHFSGSVHELVLRHG